MKTGIEILGLRASYRRNGSVIPVLHGIDMRLGLGEIGVMLGASGAGKTTVMNCAAGLQAYDSGSVVLAADHPRGAIQHTSGRSLTPLERRRIGVAFQQSHLWSNLSVLGNLVHPQVWLRGTPNHLALRRALELLEQLDMAAQREARVSELSGGQRQRLAVLRALTLQPDVLLLDEITASQDPHNVQRIFSLVKDYVATSGCTVLTISHDMEFARRIADRVFYLRDGSIAAQGALDSLLTGSNGEELRNFMGAFI